MSEWPLSIDGDEFLPVPEEWITHPNAVDHDEDAPGQPVRLYALSYALRGGGTKAVRVRYAMPKAVKVLTLQTGACPTDDGEHRPCGLFTPKGWPRSYVPSQFEEPDDVIRTAESEHMLELWGERLGLLPGSDDRLIADGGRAVRALFDCRAYRLDSREFRRDLP